MAQHTLPAARLTRTRSASHCAHLDWQPSLRAGDLVCAATPLHLPQLIGPFQHYLWILKTTHSGADMDVALEMAKGSLDNDLQWNLYDLLSHRNEWWVPGKLVELRGRLRHYREVGAGSGLGAVTLRAPLGVLMQHRHLSSSGVVLHAVHRH